MRSGNASAFAESLRLLQATIYRLGQVPRKTSLLAAPRIDRLLRKEFTSGADPYGRTWAALRPSTIATGRRPPPLTDTKRLRDGTVARPAPGGRAGLRLVAGAAYGAFAQTGFRVGRTMVKPRRIFPQFGLPAAWLRALELSAREATKAARE